MDYQLDGRWLFLLKSLKKIALGILTKDSLINTLTNVKAVWGLQDSPGLETKLARLIAADANDFQAKSQLKLYRVCQSFGSEQSPDDRCIRTRADEGGDGRRH